jgi:hypothetical protein
MNSDERLRRIQIAMRKIYEQNIHKYNDTTSDWVSGVIETIRYLLKAAGLDGQEAHDE